MHWINTISILLLTLVLNAEAYGVAVTQTQQSLDLCLSHGLTPDDSGPVISSGDWMSSPILSLYAETTEEVREETECGHSGSVFAATIGSQHRFSQETKGFHPTTRQNDAYATTPIFILNRALLN